MLTLNEHEDRVEVTLGGELTIQHAQELKAGLLDCLGRGKDVRIDLAQVDELDSAGVQLLYYAKQHARAQDLELRLCNHSPAVVEVFELYRLAPLFGDPMVLDARS